MFPSLHIRREGPCSLLAIMVMEPTQIHVGQSLPNANQEKRDRMLVLRLVIKFYRADWQLERCSSLHVPPLTSSWFHKA